MGRAAWPGNRIGDARCGNVAATTGLRVMYGEVRTSTVCNNMIKSTNHTKKKKRKTYPIGVSDEGATGPPPVMVLRWYRGPRQHGGHCRYLKQIMRKEKKEKTHGGCRSTRCADPCGLLYLCAHQNPIKVRLGVIMCELTVCPALEKEKRADMEAT